MMEEEQARKTEKEAMLHSLLLFLNMWQMILFRITQKLRKVWHNQQHGAADKWGSGAPEIETTSYSKRCVTVEWFIAKRRDPYYHITNNKISKVFDCKIKLQQQSAWKGRMPRRRWYHGVNNMMARCDGSMSDAIPWNKKDRIPWRFDRVLWMLQGQKSMGSLELWKVNSPLERMSTITNSFFSVNYKIFNRKVQFGRHRDHYLWESGLKQPQKIRVPTTIITAMNNADWVGVIVLRTLDLIFVIFIYQIDDTHLSCRLTRIIRKLFSHLLPCHR